MTKNTSQVQRLSLKCDACGEVYEGTSMPKEWYEVEAVEEVGYRLLEKVRILKSFETSNIIKRNILTFCSVGHMRKYMYHSMDNFISELKPPANRQENVQII